MDRTYFLAKAGGWMNSMPQEFINYGGGMGWLACSLAKVNFEIFEMVYHRSTPNSKYYILNEMIACKGFRSFGEVRETIKLLSTDLEEGSVLWNTAIGDGVVDEESESGELETSFTNETLEWDPEEQKLVVTAAPKYKPEKIAVRFDQQRHDSAVLAMKAVAKAVIEEEFDRRFSKLDLNCAIEEASFVYQQEEAAAYAQNPEGDYPLLSAIAESRDLTIDEMVATINTAKDRHKKVVTRLLTEMNAIKKKYKECTTTHEMNRFYEDYLGIPMPFSQAVEEGRLILSEDGTETRQEVKPGFQF